VIEEEELESQSFTCPKQVLDAGVPWTVSHFTGPKLLTGPEKLPVNLLNIFTA
jgi:hypothetical protein